MSSGSRDGVLQSQKKVRRNRPASSMSPGPRLTPLAGVRLPAEHAQPVRPAQSMHFLIVAGYVDGDQEGRLLFLPAARADDFQGVRYSANSVPRGRAQAVLHSAGHRPLPRPGCPIGESRRTVSLSVGYARDPHTIHERGPFGYPGRCAACALHRWEFLDRAWATPPPD
jgi:hypothetical protein